MASAPAKSCVFVSYVRGRTAALALHVNRSLRRPYAASFLAHSRRDSESGGTMRLCGHLWGAVLWCGVLPASCTAESPGCSPVRPPLGARGARRHPRRFVGTIADMEAGCVPAGPTELPHPAQKHRYARRGYRNSAPTAGRGGLGPGLRERWHGRAACPAVSRRAPVSLRRCVKHQARTQRADDPGTTASSATRTSNGSYDKPRGFSTCCAADQRRGVRRVSYAFELRVRSRTP